MKNKETLEEASVSFAHNYFEMHESNNYQALKLGFKAGAKWQAETYNNFTLAMDDLKYSRDGYLKAKEEYEFKKQEISRVYIERKWNEYRNITNNDDAWSFKDWLVNELRKKDTWYNEEQTNKRMNVIGQNGNDGTHY